MSYTGVVLLGGASRRYGSDKALALHNGRPMAQHAIDALQLAGAADVVTVGGSNRGFAVPHWPDLYPGEGPLGALITACRTASSEHVVLMACDLPFVGPETISALVQCAEEHTNVEVVAALTDRLEPLCAVYRRSDSLSAAQKLFDGGARSLQELLVRLKVIGLPITDVQELRNVNKPQDHLT